MKNYDNLTTTEYYEKTCELFPEYEKAFEMLTNINGFNIETINDGIYSITGYRSLSQYIESEQIEAF